MYIQDLCSIHKFDTLGDVALQNAHGLIQRLLLERTELAQGQELFHTAGAQLHLQQNKHHGSVPHQILNPSATGTN